jgi:solute carrier family 35 protein F5
MLYLLVGCGRRRAPRPAAPDGALDSLIEEERPVGGEGETDIVGNDDRYSDRVLCRWALYLAPLWFGANWAYNAGLGLTSLPSSTVLSALSGPATIALSAAWPAPSTSRRRVPLAKRVRAGVSRVAGVSIALAGVAIVAAADDSSSSSSHPHSLAGDLLCTASALAFAAYSVTLRRFVGGETGEGGLPSHRLLGVLGALNALLTLPLFPLLHFTGIERFHLPSLSLSLSLLANGLIGTALSDLLWMRAILLTSPLTGTLGLSLTIPLSLSLSLFAGLSFSLSYYAGTLCVLLGFIVTASVEATETARAEREAERARVRERERERGSERGTGEVRERERESAEVGVRVGEEESEGSFLLAGDAVDTVPPLRKREGGYGPE